jgi:hypothetical protein
MAEHPRHGVCVVTVQRQANAPALITVSVRLDIENPHDETRKHFLTERDTLAEVRAFLRTLGAPE